MIKNKPTKLLTAILSIIVLLSALSTATYAWYSAVNRAATNSISFTASSAKGGGDLAIGWSADDVTSFELSFDTPLDDLYPMIPINQAVLKSTTRNDFVYGNFNSSNQVQNTLGEWICSVAGQSVTPYICSGGDNKQEFFLINRSTDFDLEISVVYDITGDMLAEKLRVAIFAGGTASTMTLQGILAQSDNIHYGAIMAGDMVADIPKMEGAYTATLEAKFVLPKNSSTLISFVAWLDGAVMTDDDAELSAQFAVVFDGAAIG